MASAQPPVTVSYVFAGLLVRNRDAAVEWYGRLLGRPPTFLPHDGEAVWQTASTASVWVLADADRAGRGVMALVVDDLSATLKELGARGIMAGEIEVIPDAARKSTIRDPDGNEISLIEILEPVESGTD